MAASAVPSLQVLATEIADVKLIVPRIHRDHRGFFSETYNKAGLAELGGNLDFVQDNHSLSVERGVVRGLHFQIPPFAQDKLVRVIRGSVFDVAVDIRRGSPTYGKHVARIISAADWNQFLVPAGFAHAFCTLESNTEVIYKVTNYYSPEHDRGLLWNDPDLAIAWPIRETEAVLSDKDMRQPRFQDLPQYF
ncbi:MAG TPA: dTDP-4-dehydrorhamnose 3,5-epimerase [Candidatus Acidoferrum sp.]|nr:dTDP-4-dehydrorhamnose 3,5-epimerase [Candidatus Acidoferrum sp.]